MTSLVPIAMFGWIAAALALFTLLPPRRAVIAAFLAAWLFLPVYSYKWAPGIPEYSKISATACGVLLGALLFDTNRLLAFRPRWIDLPAAIWCLCPFASSLANGLGAYDGASETLRQVLTWGVPYYLGRVYFTDLASAKELAAGIFIGGLVYLPLCLWEIRMSPQLHAMVYGFQQHSFAQTYRFGGWRPQVFLQHGLAVGMWMGAASLTGLWLWSSGAVKRIWGIPMALLVPAMLVTTVLCKSSGALAVMAAGLGALFASRWLRSGLPLVALVLVAVLYMAGRAGGYLPTESLVSPVRDVFGQQRAASFETRLHSEDQLSAKALNRPALGWGGWGRSLVNPAEGQDVVITDGLWVIALGTTGLIGLGSLSAMLLLPGVFLTIRVGAGLWRHPQLAAVAALATVPILHMLDNLMNAMPNPLFVVSAGAVLSVLSAAPRRRRVVAMTRENAT